MNNSEFSATLLKLADQWRSTEVLSNGISRSLPFDDWLNAIASGQKAIELKAPTIAIDPLQRLREAGLYVVTLGGYCPVQCEATLPDGRKLYFRAIGKRWDVAIGLTSDESVSESSAAFSISSKYENEQFSAGEMPLETVADIILSAIALYQLSSGKGAIA